MAAIWSDRGFISGDFPVSSMGYPHIGFLNTCIKKDINICSFTGFRLRIEAIEIPHQIIQIIFPLIQYGSPEVDFAFIGNVCFNIF
jgi:hypothetical protein